MCPKPTYKIAPARLAVCASAAGRRADPDRVELLRERLVDAGHAALASMIAYSPGQTAISRRETSKRLIITEWLPLLRLGGLPKVKIK